MSVFDSYFFFIIILKFDLIKTLSDPFIYHRHVICISSSRLPSLRMEDEDLGELERRGEPRGLTDTAYPGTEPEPCDNLCELNPEDIKNFCRTWTSAS